MEIQGTIKVIGETEQKTEKFKQRQLVVTTDEQYPQHIEVIFMQDKCDLLNGHTLGQKVKVFINLRGKEWVNNQRETKYFNTIQGWKIEKEMP